MDRCVAERTDGDSRRVLRLARDPLHMSKILRLSTFRYQSKPRRGQGLRIGTTRYPPMYVRKRNWQRDGYFDLWFPLLAPSAALLRRTKKKGMQTRADYRAFCTAYEHELLARVESRQAIELLASMAVRTPISVGCYCEDESWCHRTHLRKLIERAAKKL